MLPLSRHGRAPLRRLLLSSPHTLSLCSHYTIGGGSRSPLLLMLSARPTPCRAGEDSSPASRAARDASLRGVSSRASAVGVDDEAPSSSAAAGYDDMSSSYLSVRIRCREEDAEVLSESLLCFGACSVTVDDIAVADAANLDKISITSIFGYGEDVKLSVSNAASSAGLDYSPVYETSVGNQCDWVTAVQETYESTEVTDGLWIIPKWRTAPDPQAINIIINPGLAFGTGEHPTTKLCLLLLKKAIKGGEHVLDYGTGTGVLGIAALKMGAALSTGIDIDAQAVTSARENMLLNGIDSNNMLVYLVATDAEPSCFSRSIDKSEENKLTSNLDLKSLRGTYDIVAANILLNPLLELVDDIVGYAKPGGTIAVSGILSEQVPKVEKVYSTYLDNILVSEMDGWACLQGIRKAERLFDTFSGKDCLIPVELQFNREATSGLVHSPTISLPELLYVMTYVYDYPSVLLQEQSHFNLLGILSPRKDSIALPELTPSSISARNFENSITFPSLSFSGELLGNGGDTGAVVPVPTLTK